MNEFTASSKKGKSLHIAPMLDVSYREFRYFMRILSKRCVLWTEMVVDETIVHSPDIDEHLSYQENCYDDENDDASTIHVKNETLSSSSIHPIICQIGGINPDYSGIATKCVEKYGYDEVNLNIDCPSSRVSGKQFGAILMKKIDTALAIVKAMKNNVNDIPISVKTRIGIDEHDNLEYLVEFIQKLRECGCKRFIIHARKCILGGLSPAQNRIVPPLNYPRVYTLCDHFPDCEFVINGGIPGLKAAKQICYGTNAKRLKNEKNNHLHSVPCSLCNASNGSCTISPVVPPPNLRGCMLGRAVMDNPAMFHDVDRYFYGEAKNPCHNRREVLEKYCRYLEYIYPRRCCDEDGVMTMKIPSPNVTKIQDYCELCRNFYQQKDTTIRKDTKYLDIYHRMTKNVKRKSKNDMKITSRVIDRSLKPVLGIFFGLPKSKTFRRICDTLSRDMNVRNCGPGFILQLAMSGMPSDILDQEFVKTEDLTEEDVPLHTAPSRDSKVCCI